MWCLELLACFSGNFPFTVFFYQFMEINEIQAMPVFNTTAPITVSPAISETSTRNAAP